MAQGAATTDFSKGHLCEVLVKLIVEEIVPSENLYACIASRFQIDELAIGKSEEHCSVIVFTRSHKALDVSHQHLGREEDYVACIS